MSANLARIPVFMRDMADIASRVLQDELALPAGRAAEVGLRISRDVCAEHACEIIYIPTGKLLNVDERDQALYAAYQRCGRNVAKVAAEFGLGIKQTYRRIRHVENVIQADLQGVLFDVPPRPRR